MTTEYDPELCARLAREAREDDDRMTPGTWREWGSDDDGFLIKHSDGAGGMLSVATVNSWDRRADNANAIARQRNSLRATAEQLEAAQARIAELERERDRAPGHDGTAAPDRLRR